MRGWGSGSGHGPFVTSHRLLFFLFSHTLFVRRRLGTWGAHVFVGAHVLSGFDYLSGICVSRYVVNISDFAILLFGKSFFRSLFRRMFFHPTASVHYSH